MPTVSTVWLSSARLHWASLSEVWRRAVGRHGWVQAADVDAMLASASGLVTQSLTAQSADLSPAQAPATDPLGA